MYIYIRNKKYLKKRLGVCTVDDDDIKELKKKVKGGHTLTIEEAVRLATFVETYSNLKGMDVIKGEIQTNNNGQLRMCVRLPLPSFQTLTEKKSAH